MLGVVVAVVEVVPDPGWVVEVVEVVEVLEVVVDEDEVVVPEDVVAPPDPVCDAGAAVVVGGEALLLPLLPSVVVGLGCVVLGEAEAPKAADEPESGTGGRAAMRNWSWARSWVSCWISVWAALSKTSWSGLDGGRLAASF